MAAKKVDALEERLEGEMNQIKTTVEERMSSMEGQVADLRDIIKKMLEVHNQTTASVARSGEGRSTNSEIRREEEEAEIVEGERRRPHLEPIVQDELSLTVGGNEAGNGSARVSLQSSQFCLPSPSPPSASLEAFSPPPWILNFLLLIFPLFPPRRLELLLQRPVTGLISLMCLNLLLRTSLSPTSPLNQRSPLSLEKFYQKELKTGVFVWSATQ
ncbi:hypothetical protein M5K25_024425 [Dendrobium thyrsiflorum]|uniref:Uncharacterized protein n=1 Tax=Dendrobium thyrsiflorum TaxID=117978 RepID=A0ABD0U1U4_DENTH